METIPNIPKKQVYHKLPQSVLITGAASGLATVLVDNLLLRAPHIHIVGLDSRKIETPPPTPRIKYIHFQYSRSELERIFHNFRFDMVIHLGRWGLSHTETKRDLFKQINVEISTVDSLLDLAVKYKLRKVIVLSSYHVYGAKACQGIFLKEDTPILTKHEEEELNNLITMDSTTTNWIWKDNNGTEIILYRPCNIIGPHIKNAITQILCAPYAFCPIDYQTKFQFIHEQDVARLIILAMKYLRGGIYNMAPEEVFSFSEAKKLVGTQSLPFFLTPTLVLQKFWKGALPFLSYPPYFLEFLRHSCLLSSEKLAHSLPHHKIFEYSSETSLKNLLHS